MDIETLLKNLSLRSLRIEERQVPGSTNTRYEASVETGNVATHGIGSTAYSALHDAIVNMQEAQKVQDAMNAMNRNKVAHPRAAGTDA